MSPVFETLKIAHKKAAKVVGDISICLTQSAVKQSDIHHWIMDLRAAANTLDAILMHKEYKE